MRTATVTPSALGAPRGRGARGRGGAARGRVGATGGPVGATLIAATAPTLPAPPWIALVVRAHGTISEEDAPYPGRLKGMTFRQ